jgi:hypothetical protein
VLGFTLRSRLKPVTCTLLSTHVTVMRLLDVATAETGPGVVNAAFAGVPLHAIPTTTLTMVRAR